MKWISIPLFLLFLLKPHESNGIQQIPRLCCLHLCKHEFCFLIKLECHVFKDSKMAVSSFHYMSTQTKMLKIKSGDAVCQQISRLILQENLFCRNINNRKTGFILCVHTQHSWSRFLVITKYRACSQFIFTINRFPLNICKLRTIRTIFSSGPCHRHIFLLVCIYVCIP